MRLKPVISICLLLMITLPALAADKLKIPSKQVAAALAAVNKMFAKHPERVADFVPAGHTLTEDNDEVVVRYSIRSGELVETRLNSVRNNLVDLGLTIQGWKNRDNMFRVYKLVRSKLPAKYKKRTTDPKKLKQASLSQLRSAYKSLHKLILVNFEDLVRITEIGKIDILRQNPIGDCSAEIGTETAGFNSEVSDRCELSEYSVSGLFINNNFPLKDNLTCIKDQGSRGTCSAQSTVAAVESVALVNGDPAQNLSEQHYYQQGEKYGDSQISVFEPQLSGLSTGTALQEYENRNLPFYYERDWNYNRSLNLGSVIFDVANSVFTYPNSCVSYSGEACTDYVFQTTATILPLALIAGIIPDLPPSGSSAVHRISSFGFLLADDIGGAITVGMLQAAVLLVAGDVPVIVTMSVTEEMLNTTTGYVRYSASDPIAGAHAIEIIGFVPNSSLPAGVTAATEQGYFIVKNSWGINAGDCGFYYLDFGYLRHYASYISYVEIT